MTGRLAVTLATAALAVAALTAVPALGAAAPPPPGCAPVALGAVPQDASEACIHHVLVTETDNASEQGGSSFTVSDGVSSLRTQIGRWWPQGPPTAGMVVTLWGRQSPAGFVVDRWLELTHGIGPSPAGPYPRVRAIDVSAGRIPEHRMVWVAATVFLVDPQTQADGGDGDIHVQTMTQCPSAGVTTETTPPLRGYVDHPAIAGLTSSNNTQDDATNHLADAPPVGVPVMILGATRYDYGFGWWEIHPVRAWRPLSAAEAAQFAADCAGDPVPHLDQLDTSSPAAVPVPFGVPPCTDGSEFGNPANLFMSCGAQCYVAHTAIGEPETLVGPCEGIVPVVTPSQEGMSETGVAGASPLTGSVTATGAAAATAEGAAGAATPASTAPNVAIARTATTAELSSLDRIYGGVCARVAGAAGHAHCLVAMARMAGGETSSPQVACRGQSPLPAPGARRSPLQLCEAAARTLLARLVPARIREG